MSSVTDEHLDLRFRVLRKNQPRESAHYPGIDVDKRTKFLGAFIKEKLSFECSVKTLLDILK